ncbi:MAG: hypothetical protein AVDCRST_MAG10-1661, partial [uncultured Acidimicrobiales bacterium]
EGPPPHRPQRRGPVRPGCRPSVRPPAGQCGGRPDVLRRLRAGRLRPHLGPTGHGQSPAQGRRPAHRTAHDRGDGRRIGAGQRGHQVVLPPQAPAVGGRPTALRASAAHQQLPQRPRHLGSERGDDAVGGRQLVAVLLDGGGGRRHQPDSRQDPSRLRRRRRACARRRTGRDRPPVAAGGAPL